MYVAAGLAHAILTALAFPPADLWPLALLAPMPLIWACLHASTRPDPSPGTHTRTGPHAGFWTALGVLPLWVFEERWLIDVAGLWYILLALNLALYSWLFVSISGGALRRTGPRHILWIMPLVWTGIEVLRGELIWGGYAWYLAGHPLIASPLLAAPAAIGGQYLVSLLVVATATTLLLACKPGLTGALPTPRFQRDVAVGATVLVVGGWTLLGWWSGHGPDHTRGNIRIAVIQTNLRQDNKERLTPEASLRDFAEFLALTERAAAHDPKPEVIVWPETMFPGAALNTEAVAAQRAAGLMYRIDSTAIPEPLRPMLEGQAAPGILPATFFADALGAVQKRLGIPMLVGAMAVDGLEVTVGERGQVRQKYKARFNSALVIVDGIVQPDRYDKMELMAFGEVVPYVWRFPALAKAIVELGVQGWTMDLGWGTRDKPLAIALPTGSGQPGGVARFATPICFEATMSRVARALTRNGAADALVNITNDGWFGTFAGCREAHLLAARWRCVEFHLPMVRAANTGISCLVDARGKIETRLPPHAQDVLHISAPLRGNSRPTPFARWGNAPAFGTLALTGCLAAWVVAGTLRRHPSPAGHA